MKRLAEMAKRIAVLHRKMGVSFAYGLQISSIVGTENVNDKYRPLRYIAFWDNNVKLCTITYSISNVKISMLPDKSGLFTAVCSIPIIRAGGEMIFGEATYYGNRERSEDELCELLSCFFGKMERAMLTQFLNYAVSSPKSKHIENTIGLQGVYSEFLDLPLLTSMEKAIASKRTSIVDMLDAYHSLKLKMFALDISNVNQRKVIQNISLAIQLLTERLNYLSSKDTNLPIVKAK